MRALIMILFATTIAAGWYAGGRRSAGPLEVEAARPGLQPGDQRASVTLVRSADGHFRVDGAVAGTGLTFLIDTGATDVVLGRDDAARLGLRVAGGGFTGEARTASGLIRVAHMPLPRVRLGAIRLSNVPAMIVDADHVVPLLGQSFLSRLDRVSIEQDRMVLAGRRD